MTVSDTPGNLTTVSTVEAATGVANPPTLWPTHQDPLRSRKGFRESPDPRSLEDVGSQEVKDYSISSAGRSSAREIQPNLILFAWDSGP